MVQALRALITRKERPPAAACERLDALPLGAEGTVALLDVGEDAGRRLQELGFLPGTRVLAAWAAPGGDPRVYRVDGAEVALRRETAERIVLRAPGDGCDVR